MRGGSRARSRSNSPNKSSGVREGRLESALRSTEEERDYFKREYELQVRDHSDCPVSVFICDLPHNPRYRSIQIGSCTTLLYCSIVVDAL